MDINVVFAIGALCGAAALIFLLLLERELKETAVQFHAAGRYGMIKV